LRIGIVDLDTSHPQNWIPLERELGHEVFGVWDGGSVHPPEYATQFATDHGIPRVYASLEEMAADVDCAILHGCDWDTHVAKAWPFVEAGKSVLIDKPLAGKPGDLAQLQQWVRDGARITGGSSLRFCRETAEWLAQPVKERGTPHTVLCGCAVDEFNYGIHAYSMLTGILGAGIASVKHLGSGVQRRVQVNWADGRVAFLVIGKAAGWVPFYATVVTERGVFQYTADSKHLYRALLESVLPYLARETDQPPVPLEALMEAELAAIAARHSWQNGDQEVTLENLPPDEGYDGAAFGAEYRSMRYPNG
jgi:predicted dehydrogenase